MGRKVWPALTAAVVAVLVVFITVEHVVARSQTRLSAELMDVLPGNRCAAARFRIVDEDRSSDFAVQGPVYEKRVVKILGDSNCWRSVQSAIATRNRAGFARNPDWLANIYRVDHYFCRRADGIEWERMTWL